MRLIWTERFKFSGKSNNWDGKKSRVFTSGKKTRVQILITNIYSKNENNHDDDHHSKLDSRIRSRR